MMAWRKGKYFAKYLRNPEYIRGIQAQYTQFRYGQPKKQVTLARVFKGEARGRIEDEICEAMRDWRETPFENEGPFRAAVRSSLCLNGYAWDRSDAEAAELVRVALHRQGAKRPTWEEGQRTYTESPDFCSWCRGPLSADDIASAHRFCCVECARMAITRRDYGDGAEGAYSPARRKIYNLITKLESTPRLCKACGKPFQTRHKKIQFCSHECAMIERRNAGSLQDINCEWCGKMFRQREQTRRYCCYSCAARARHANARMLTLTCDWCGGAFESKKPWAKFCCIQHRRAYNAPQDAARRAARRKEAKVASLTPAIFDEWFKEAA